MPIPPPGTEWIETVLGRMAIPLRDCGMTCTVLRQNGEEALSSEVKFVRKVMRLGGAFLDVGAHIGTWSLRLRDMAGAVISFEPQQRLFNVLSVNLSPHKNCHPILAAVSNCWGSIDVPQFADDAEFSMGSVEIGTEQTEDLKVEPVSMEKVPCVSIDWFLGHPKNAGLPRVSAIKIDTEGMECEALEGAVRTIRRDKPVIAVEVLKSDPLRLAHLLSALEYRVGAVMNLNWICLPAAKGFDQSFRKEA